MQRYGLLPPLGLLLGRKRQEDRKKPEDRHHLREPFAPDAAQARADAAEASAAAAVAWAKVGAIHEAAYHAALNSGAPEETVRVEFERGMAAWGVADKVLALAKKADPDSEAVPASEAAMEAERRFRFK